MKKIWLFFCYLKGLEVGLIEEDGEEVDPELGIVEAAHDESLGPVEAQLPLDVRVRVHVRRPREYEALYSVGKD